MSVRCVMFVEFFLTNHFSKLNFCHVCMISIRTKYFKRSFSSCCDADFSFSSCNFFSVCRICSNAVWITDADDASASVFCWPNLSLTTVYVYSSLARSVSISRCNSTFCCLNCFNNSSVPKDQIHRSNSHFGVKIL